MSLQDKYDETVRRKQESAMRETSHEVDKLLGKREQQIIFDFTASKVNVEKAIINDGKCTIDYKILGFFLHGGNSVPINIKWAAANRYRNDTTTDCIKVG
jgi:hypothetical protein